MFVILFPGSTATFLFFLLSVPTVSLRNCSIYSMKLALIVSPLAFCFGRRESGSAGFTGTSPLFRKPERKLLDPETTTLSTNAFKSLRNSAFESVDDRAVFFQFSSKERQDLFNGAKYATSNGCRRCVLFGRRGTKAML